MNFLDPRLPDRFWDKCTPEPNTGCWLWLGCVITSGYGQIRWRDRSVSVHRLAYEALRAPIPEGLSIDHLCEVKVCCNPSHLDVCTTAENSARHRLRHPLLRCSNGHPFVDGSYYLIRNASGYVRRDCKECRSAHSRAYNERRKLLASAFQVKAS